MTAVEWAGNERELRNALAFAFAIGDQPELALADLPPEIGAAGEVGAEVVVAGAEVVVAAADAVADDDQTPEVRRIRDALGRTARNRDRAATLLGLSRDTMAPDARVGLEDALQAILVGGSGRGRIPTGRSSVTQR